MLNDSELAHYGVPGMKWGRRKIKAASNERREFRTRMANYKPITVKVIAKNGKEMTLEQRPWPKSTIFTTSLTKGGRFRAENNKFVDLKVDGETVGDAVLEKKKNGSIYLNWLGVNENQQGNGYGTAAFKAAIEYAKQEGATKLTLEVPGRSPNAAHIYTKQGFKNDGRMIPSPIWGGLQPMSLSLTDDTLKHSGESDEELELALRETFTQLPQEVWDELEREKVVNEKDDSELAHYGVPGMKWGRRKGSTSSSKRQSPKKRLANMSDNELKAVNKRQQMEGEFLRRNRGVVGRGHDQVKATLGVIGTGVAIYNLAGSPAGKATITAGKTLVKKALDKYTIDFS